MPSPLDGSDRRALASFARRLTAVEKAVRRRGTAQEQYRSVEGGSQEVYDDDGVLRLIVGEQDDGTHTIVEANAPAPPVPAAPGATGGAGVLVVTSYGVTADGSAWPLDLGRVDVHVGAPGFEPVALLTKVAEFGPDGGSVTIALDPGDWSVVLVAVNNSGTESAPSTPATATVTAIATGAGGVATYSTDDPPVGLGLDDDGSLWFDTNAGNLPYRWDGPSGQWVPMPVGSDATAPDVIAGKAVPINRAMSLEWAVPDPPTALATSGTGPVYAAGWKYLPSDADVSTAELGNMGGLVLASGVYYSATVVYTNVIRRGVTKMLATVTIVGSDGSRHTVVSRIAQAVAAVGLTRIGTTWHVMLADTQMLRVWRLDSTFAVLGSWSEAQASTRVPVALTADGTNLIAVVHDTSAAQYRFETRNPTTGAVASTVAAGDATFGSETPWSFQYGTFDFGAARIVAVTASRAVSLNASTGAQVGTETFDLPTSLGQYDNSRGYYTATYDGSRFVIGTAASLWRSSPLNAAATVWGSYGHKESAGGLETKAAPVATAGVVIPPRSGLYLYGPGVRPPAIDEDPSPDSTTVYLYTGTGQPALASLREVGAVYATRVTYASTTGEPSEDDAAVFVDAPFTRTADAPLTASTFPAGDAGALASELGGFDVRGDGTGDWPFLRTLVAAAAAKLYALKGHTHGGVYAPASVEGRVSTLESNGAQSGRATVTIAAGTNPVHGTLTITFPEPFEVAPVCNANVYGVTNVGNFGVGIDQETPTTVTIRVTRIGGSATSVDIRWVAVPPT